MKKNNKKFFGTPKLQKTQDNPGTLGMPRATRGLRALAAVILILGLTNTGWSALDSLAQSQILAQAVQQHYGLEGGLELTPVTPLAALAQSPSTVELLELPANPTSTMLIKARFEKNGVKLADISAAFRAQWRVRVLVAKKQMSRGLIDVGSFDIQTIDRLSLRQVPVPAHTDLKGYELAGPVATGAALTWNVVKSQPLVKKGAVVEVIAEEDGLKITTRAIAMHDAGKGEQVQMRNTSTNRQFEAYVINENLAKIRL